MRKIFLIPFVALLSGLGFGLSAQTTSFSYTGAVQTYTVPTGVTTINVDLAGAQGGNFISPVEAGGMGGRVQASVAVSPGQVLYVYIGQQPASSLCASGGAAGLSSGGGEDGGYGSSHYSGCGGSGGGGATDIRTTAGSLTTRLMVGAGGGGSGYNCGENGGACGGATGGTGLSCGAYTVTNCGGPGTQTAGGAAGIIGSPTAGALGAGGNASTFSGGGGGGGFYGGGGAYSGSACGGSSYPPTGATCTSGPGAGLVTAITNTAGFQTGNGYCIITPVCSGGAGTISGPSTVNTGSTITLTDGISGGTWSSSNTSIATVVSTTGVVTGVSAGTVTISYGVACGGTISYATYTVTVTIPNRISGHINFTGTAVDTTSVLKIWLINYNPSTHLLGAVDSITTTASSSSVYYQFLSEPTDSYRVKAAYIPATFSATGYQPTYHTSYYYWHDASAFYHTGGADDGTDIAMGYGTVTTGPGFIAGDVTTGANKGTSGGGPAVGLLMYCKNASGTILQQAITNSTGNYSFSNLLTGQTYTVFPEALNYATTPYAGISLTSLKDTMTSINFVQHTISKTITPVYVGISNTSVTTSAIEAYPNPTDGILNLKWKATTTEKAEVMLFDQAGRQVYSNMLNLTAGSGASQIDMSSFAPGTYTITVKSASITYTNKIQLLQQH